MFLSLFAITTAHDHYECQHDKITKGLHIDVTDEPYQKNFEKQTWTPLNIDIVYSGTYCTAANQIISRIDNCGSSVSYTCTADDVLTTEKSNFIKNTIIPRARAFFAETLSVTATGVTVSSGTCCAVTTASSYSSTGNYVLFVTFSPTTGSTLAWAAACKVDGTGRPYAGHANFGPNKINVNKTETAFVTAVHEMTHALGFSSGLYGYFKQRSGSTLSAYTQVSTTVTERGHSVTKLVTPKLVQYVQDHFNCSTMTNPGAGMCPCVSHPQILPKVGGRRWVGISRIALGEAHLQQRAHDGAGGEQDCHLRADPRPL